MVVRSFSGSLRRWTGHVRGTAAAAIAELQSAERSQPDLQDM